MSRDDPTHRPIVACRIENDGQGVLHLRVYCPREGASVPLRRCESCAAHIELPAGRERGFVVCGAEAEEACQRLEEAPTIGALVTSSVRAVRESASLATAIELLAGAGAEPVLVVDAEGQCVGALSRMEVLRNTPGAVLGLPDPGSTAREAMTQAKVAVETASVREVLRTMATQRLRWLAIVAEDGSPLGMVSDLEALRLLAELRG